MKIRIMTLLASAALAMPVAALAAEVPQRGMSEARVRADFGSPSSVRGPVGSPAITRWNYDGFSVYFENGITLHTVVDRPASAVPDVVSGTRQEPPQIEETATDTEQELQAAPESAAPPMFDPVTGNFVGAEPETAPVEEVEEQPAASNAPAQEAPQQDAEPEPEPAPKPQAAAAEEAPEAAPEPAPKPQATEQPPAEGEFRFDPVTGRIIIAGEITPEQAAAKKQQELEQKAKETAEATKAQADQVEEQATAAVENAEQQSDNVAADAQEKVSEAQQQVDADVKEDMQEKTDQAKQAAEQAEEESEGGFYIDWGARQ